MPFRKIKWPKSEEKLKLGVGGVCHGDKPTESAFNAVLVTYQGSVAASANELEIG